MNIDFRNIRFFQQDVPDLVGDILKLGVTEAIAIQRIDTAKHVAKLIIYFGRQRTQWQVRYDRIDFAPQVVKDRPHYLVTFLEVHIDDGYAGTGFADNIVDLRHFLNFLFYLVGNQFLHTFRAGAGKTRRDQDRPDDETRILRLGNILKCEQAGNQHQRNHRQRNAVFFNRFDSQNHEKISAMAIISE